MLDCSYSTTYEGGVNLVLSLWLEVPASSGGQPLQACFAPTLCSLAESQWLTYLGELVPALSRFARVHAYTGPQNISQI
jgi:hypothetical protein